MSNFVLVLGKSGTGKSTSIKSLNPKETVVINVLGKRLPFKGSAGMYNPENKNLFKVKDWNSICNLLTSIDEKAHHVKNVIIDDACYIMREEFFDRSKERGFDKYNELADHFRRIIAKSSSLRDDLNVFMFLHTEPIEDNGNLIGYKVATVGKLLDKMYDPTENVAITLFSEPQFDDKGIPTFGFYTHKRKIGNVELPCKSPDEMFEEDFIPNDLGLVVKAMTEYYG